MVIDMLWDLSYNVPYEGINEQHGLTEKEVLDWLDEHLNRGFYDDIKIEPSGSRSYYEGEEFYRTFSPENKGL